MLIISKDRQIITWFCLDRINKSIEGLNQEEVCSKRENSAIEFNKRDSGTPGRNAGDPNSNARRPNKLVRRPNGNEERSYRYSVRLNIDTGRTIGNAGSRNNNVETLSA